MQSWLYDVSSGLLQLDRGHTRFSNCLLIVRFNRHSVIRLRIDELIVQDLDILVIGREERNAVGNCLSVGKSRDIAADTREGQDELLRVASAQLCLALLSQNNDVVITRLVIHHFSRSTSETAVHASAKTFVGAGNNEKSFLVAVFSWLGLGLVEDLLRCFAVLLRLLHGLLSLGELGAGHNLHRLCDFGDVLDGLQAAFNFAEGGIVGVLESGDSDCGRPASCVSDLFCFCNGGR